MTPEAFGAVLDRHNAAVHAFAQGPGVARTQPARVGGAVGALSRRVLCHAL